MAVAVAMDGAVGMADVHAANSASAILSIVKVLNGDMPDTISQRVGFGNGIRPTAPFGAWQVARSTPDGY